MDTRGRRPWQSPINRPFVRWCRLHPQEAADVRCQIFVDPTQGVLINRHWDIGRLCVSEVEVLDSSVLYATRHGRLGEDGRIEVIANTKLLTCDQVGEFHCQLLREKICEWVLRDFLPGDHAYAKLCFSPIDCVSTELPCGSELQVAACFRYRLADYFQKKNTLKQTNMYARLKGISPRRKLSIKKIYVIARRGYLHVGDEK